MHISLATQVVSLVGALLILCAYVGHQLRWLDARRPFYNLANLVGAAILAWIALRPLQAGFAIMEVTWTVISVLGVVRALRSRGDAAAR
ncbi:MAG TPA: hypothetical protein VLT85_02665 [Terriglobales bacterium]|nr:hypothetical protein [Terriglobales bacterium]